MAVSVKKARALAANAGESLGSGPAGRGGHGYAPSDITGKWAEDGVV
jgi:hypothetical protein